MTGHIYLLNYYKLLNSYVKYIYNSQILMRVSISGSLPIKLFL